MQSKIKSQQKQLPNIYFILLINTKSGGGWGKRYLQLKKLQHHFQYKKIYNIHIKMVDLLNTQKRQQQLKKAKQLQQSTNNDIRVIICGGDGTIIWGIKQCYRAGMQMSKITFGCLPIGTGNDFSRTIGWGSSPLQFQQGNLYPLKKRIMQWIQSATLQYDVWQVQISIYNKGGIFVVKNGEDFLTNKTVHKTGFVNYVGIGIDARVSYNFQKHRRSTKVMNYGVYTLMACLLCCKSLPSLNEAVEGFQQGQDNNDSEINNINSNDNNSQSTKHQVTKMIMKQNNLQQPMIRQQQQSNSNRSSRKIPIKKGYHGLICLNSVSYMAGAMNAWQTKRNIAVDKSLKFQRQSVNDGKVQFVGYKNEIVLGLQRFFHTGAKVAQGEGPFVMRFKEQQDKQIRSYVQVDGEGVMIRGLRQIVIRRNVNVPVIRVMLGKGFK